MGGLLPARPKHHQRLTAHHSQPDLDIKTERLPVKFCDFVCPFRCLNVHLKRFWHAA